MTIHTVRVYLSKAKLPRKTSWPGSWPYAADRAPVTAAVEDVVVDRIIDNAAVAVAAINRQPVCCARSQALAHPRPSGATVFGLPARLTFQAEWAAWANGAAVRELDMHDTFLAADYSHPADNIPPLLAVPSSAAVPGGDLVRGPATPMRFRSLW